MQIIELQYPEHLDTTSWHRRLSMDDGNCYPLPLCSSSIKLTK